MQMQHSTSMSGAVQHRLYGGINRIQWRPHDVSAIMERFAGSTETANVPTQRDAPTPPAAWEGKATGDVNRTFTFTISSATVDRMGDSVAVEGWKLDNYKKNPVVLWGHDGTMLPVGKATRVWVQGGKLKATAELAPASVSQYAERVRGMISAGYLNATSVGFAPLRMKLSNDKNRPYGIDFIEQELLEFSIVSIPANPDALLDPGQLTKAAQVRRMRELDLIRIRAGAS
jgi:HK97 family phage prohead protease